MVAAIEQKIEGKYLEESQRKAILESGKNILVNAGAGSGKTFTILAKILHILDQNLAKPEEIIVVAYNTSVANDLRDRLENLAEVFPNLENKIKKVSVAYGKKCPECNEKIDQALHFCEEKNKFVPRQIHTFHSYCYDLLKKNEKPQIAKHLEESERKLQELRKAKFLEKIVEEIGSKDKSFFKKINKFFLNYIQHYKNIFKDINNMADYNRAIKPRHVALKIIDKDDEQIDITL
jgi:ATP-dependent exoDNAse (exonuclease V) beta subunit